jgi:hypothetical protein
MRCLRWVGSIGAICEQSAVVAASKDEQKWGQIKFQDVVCPAHTPQLRKFDLTPFFATARRLQIKTLIFTLQF